jgi:hypothetical protein
MLMRGLRHLRLVAGSATFSRAFSEDGSPLATASLESTQPTDIASLRAQEALTVQTASGELIKLRFEGVADPPDWRLREGDYWRDIHSSDAGIDETAEDKDGS